MIRAVINEWLGAIEFDAPPDLSKMTEGKQATYKRGAKTVLSNATYQGEVSRIVEFAKNKIALQCKDDLDVAFYRGTLNGLKLLGEALLSLSANHVLKSED